MLLIYADPAWREGEQAPKLMSDIVAQHIRLGEDMRAAGVAYSGHQL
jgi:hypothetical protein